MSIENEILKRLKVLEDKIDVIGRYVACSCGEFTMMEHEGSWYCDYHGRVRGWWGNHRYNKEYESG